jgi:hypothetical protein
MGAIIAHWLRMMACIVSSPAEQVLRINKKPSRTPRGFCELVGEILRGAHDVARLKTFRAFEQIEFDASFRWSCVLVL